MEKYQLIATAAAGIEALVGKELRRLGYDTRWRTAGSATRGT